MDNKDFKPVKDEPQIYKQAFDRKVNREDGMLLQIHHTIPGPTGDIRRTRFLHASFNSSEDKLVVNDHRGNLFVIDVSKNMFWFLGKLESISLLCFHSHSKDTILIGFGTNSLMFMNAETAREEGSLIGHTERPTQATFDSSGHFCLTVGSSEGFIWDLRSLTQAHRLTLQPGMNIKLALFMPVSNNIIASFQDDAIHVWAFDSFQCIKQFVPDSWKGHDIRSITFTRNGRAMVVGGLLSSQLVIFVVDDWTLQRVIHLPDSVSGVKELEFVPDMFDSGANKILAVLSTNGSLCFIDLNEGCILSIDIQDNTRSFTCSRAGKYFACILSSGEVKIFSTAQLLANKRVKKKTISESALSVTVGSKVGEAIESNAERDEQKPITEEERKPFTKPRSKTAATAKRHTNKEHLIRVNKQVAASLDVNRLQPILREFSEYPEQYRSLIWRTVLQLPGNKAAWQSLADRELHPSAACLSEIYTLENKIMLKCLQSVVSCLAHWSPVFGELPYLPSFVFPFIKVFHSDAFVCFEAAATIITNWCQHWFEYLSFPPVNILGMVENVLSEHDVGLLSMFCKAGVTTRVYAWSLLSNAFSEVLSSKQWLQLWDHVLSNPPWFLIFAVVAYNICSHASLKTCTDIDDYKYFYSNQNPLNMKLFIKKTYSLMEKTSSENHPKQYFHKFSPLTQGNYPVFSAYPKFIVDYQKNQKDAFRKEEEKILREQCNLLKDRLACEEQYIREHNARVHAARLLDAEKAAQVGLQEEEARLVERRRQLARLSQDLRARERDMLARSRVELMEQQSRQRSALLERMDHQVQKCEQLGTDEETVNEELREQFNRLIIQKELIQQRLNHLQSEETARDVANDILPHIGLTELKKQYDLLVDEIDKLRRERRAQKTRVDVGTRLAEMDCLKQQAEVTLAHRAKEQQDALITADNKLKEVHAETKIRDLELEVEKLLEQLANTKSKSDVETSDNMRPRYTHISDRRHTFQTQSDTSGGNSVLRSTNFYCKEQSAVNSAMELRKQLLSGWSKR